MSAAVGRRLEGLDRPQIVVTVDLDTLRTHVGAATLDDGSLLSAGAARRLACDAAILPAVLGAAGQQGRPP